MSEPAVLTAPDIPDIVQRYLDGESVYQLAENSRVSMQTIYNWMHTELGEEYKTVKRKVFINRLADADYEVMTAPSKLELARAREMAKNTRWDIERAFPEQFAQRQQINTDSKITVIVQRDRPQPVVVGGNTVEMSVVSTRDVTKDSA